MLKSVQTAKVVPAFMEGILVAYYQALEAFTISGLKGVLRPRFFRNRQATPAEMDLSAVPPSSDPAGDSGYQFVELKTEEVRAGRWSFAVRSRYYKTLRNLRRGLRSFALVEGCNVVGDVWCTGSAESEHSALHPDLKMLGITCREKEVYAFDMFIDPKYRGKNFAVPLQRFLHRSLKNEGFRKVYGFYWNDNLPALWMHRMLKYRELPKRRISRFLFLQKYENVDAN